MSSQPTVCILTSAHPLDDVRVKTKIADSFLDAGHDVLWVGPETAYFSDPRDRDTRIRYHLVEPARGRIDRLRSASRVVRRAQQLEGVDWFYCPDPDAAAAATTLCRSTGARLLFDVHEVFHGALLDRWIPPGFDRLGVREIVRRRIAATCRRSDLVIGVNDAVLRPYVDSTVRHDVVRNCAPRRFAAPARPVADDCRPGTTFMHGKALPTNGTPVVLEALSHPSLRDVDASVVTFGNVGAADLTSALVTAASSHGVADKVIVQEPVPHDRMPAVLAACDVGMVAYGRALGVDSLPNRIFEYMAAGIAVLVPSYAEAMTRIVETEGIGRVVDFENPEQVAVAMRRFVDDPVETREMGRRARDAFLARHSWEAEFSRLLDLMGQASWTAGRLGHAQP